MLTVVCSDNVGVVSAIGRTFRLLLVLLLAGCASGGFVGSLPIVPDPSTAATIVLVRPSSFLGAARLPTIAVDGVDAYDIGPGEHVVMAVAPGERIIGGRLWDAPDRVTATIQAEPGRTYYFVVSAAGVVARITENEGRKLQAETTPIQQNGPGRAARGASVGPRCRTGCTARCSGRAPAAPLPSSRARLALAARGAASARGRRF